jgi:hypothetical protein
MNRDGTPIKDVRAVPLLHHSSLPDEALAESGTPLLRGMVPGDAAGSEGEFTFGVTRLPDGKEVTSSAGTGCTR